MIYTTTRDSSARKTFAEIVTLSNAPCGGLYIPLDLPLLRNEEFRGLSYGEIAEKIIGIFTGISREDIAIICRKALGNFENTEPVAVKKLRSGLVVAELFHGPTLSFKDYPMQFLGYIIEHILGQSGKKLNIITATSGDTGSAAIRAFAGKENVKIVVLHPRGRVTEFQRKQMTTVHANNLLNIAVEGTFDDCQKIVKDITNSGYAKDNSVSTVNSINWGRIMMQTVYYIWLVCKQGRLTDFYVPTGNFGNIFACYFLKKCGFGDIGRLYISNNANDVISTAYTGGLLRNKETVHTISPAVDIAIPSNFERMLYLESGRDSEYIADLYQNLGKGGEIELRRDVLTGFKAQFGAVSISDDEVIRQIQETYRAEKYVIDPHTALSFAHVKQGGSWENSVVISTAHPCKFQDAISRAIGVDVSIPESNLEISAKGENYETCSSGAAKNRIFEWFATKNLDK